MSRKPVNLARRQTKKIKYTWAQTEGGGDKYQIAPYELSMRTFPTRHSSLPVSSVHIRHISSIITCSILRNNHSFFPHMHETLTKYATAICGRKKAK